MALKNLIKQGTYSIIDDIEFQKDFCISFRLKVYSDSSKDKTIIVIPYREKIKTYNVREVDISTELDTIGNTEIVRNIDGKLYQKISDNMLEFKEWENHFSVPELEKENHNIIERCYEYVKQSDLANDTVEDC